MTSLYDLPDLRPFRTIQRRMRLTGGAVVTEHGVLQSDDYVPGVAGWAIFGDGSVEFNDGVFRGDVDATGLNLSLTEADDGAIEFYDINNMLVGRLSSGSWELGDLTTPGLRTTLDPIGGLRFRSEADELIGILDQQGLSIRDELTGLVVAELSRDAMRLRDVSTSQEILLSTRSATSLFKPRFAAASEGGAVGATLDFPAATKFATNDLELGHTSAYKRGTVQAATSTPPAGWTEVTDTDTGIASTLHASLQRRAVATGTAGTVTSSQSNWDTAIGTHIIVKGVVGGTTPSVRSTSELEQTATATTVVLSMTPPAGLAAGDLLLAFISMGNSGGSVPTGWITPEGWVFLGATVALTGSGATMSTNAVGVWAKHVTASEPSTYETTINFGAGTKTVHGLLVAIQNPEAVPGGPQFNIGGFNLAGPWLPYTPTNTNITVGNGTNPAYYLIMGKTVFFRWELNFGSTTSFGGNVVAGLPVAAAVQGAGVAGWARDFGVRGIAIGGSFASGASGVTLQHDAAGNTGIVNATNPITWGTSDSINLIGVYEAA